MRFLIVPIGQESPKNEASVNMDFIKFLSDMEVVAGFAIPIAIGWSVWNSLRKTGRWETSEQARNDPDFQNEFLDTVSSDRYWDE